jgi:hypothetical protein
MPHLGDEMPSDYGCLGTRTEKEEFELVKQLLASLCREIQGRGQMPLKSIELRNWWVSYGAADQERREQERKAELRHLEEKRKELQGLKDFVAAKERELGLNKQGS